MNWLAGKKLVWRESIRIFTDNGQPIFRLLPRVRRIGFDKYWDLWGFAVYWLGREFNFVFGKDKKGLYSPQ